ncbi:MAG: M48 family metalloprotease [Simkaniaceae bacterium]|nr:M48 family metalloprotease [Simkaniaceae bacterium]
MESRDGPCLLESMKAGKQRLLHRTGVRKDIAIVRCRSVDVAFATGINASRSGSAVVYLNEDIYRVDRDCSGFFCNHEIKHVLSNDNVTVSVIDGVNDLVRPVVLGVGCLKAMRAFFRRGIVGGAGPLFGAVATCLVCNRIADALFRWREAKADDFAIAHATDEELKGGRRFFTVCARMETDRLRIVRDHLAEGLSYPFGVWRELLMESSSGWRYLFDPRHPSNKSRLRKIEKALAVRGVEIDGQAEEQRVERLRICWVEQMKSALLYRLSGSYPAIMYRVLDAMVVSDATDTSEESFDPDER